MCTHQAHYMHTYGTHQAQRFDRSFLKISDVPFVCHMCADNWGACERFKIENYRQFPFQRRVARQNRTFLGSCGSIIRSIKIECFGEFQSSQRGGSEKRCFSDPPARNFCGSTYKCSNQIKIFLRKLYHICSSDVKTFDFCRHFY